MRRCNRAGRDLIQYFEGLRLLTYKDIAGVATIGYGHTGKDVTEGKRITYAEAQELFEKDLAVFEKGVDSLLTGPSISDNAFSALCSFAYNLGLANLKSSTLLKYVNKGRLTDASKEFVRWCKSGGKEIPGLIARRRAERDLFLTL